MQLTCLMNFFDSQIIFFDIDLDVHNDMNTRDVKYIWDDRYYCLIVFGNKNGFRKFVICSRKYQNQRKDKFFIKAKEDL